MPNFDVRVHLIWSQFVENAALDAGDYLSPFDLAAVLDPESIESVEVVARNDLWDEEFDRRTTLEELSEDAIVGPLSEQIDVDYPTDDERPDGGTMFDAKASTMVVITAPSESEIEIDLVRRAMPKRFLSTSLDDDEVRPSDWV